MGNFLWVSIFGQILEGFYLSGLWWHCSMSQSGRSDTKKLDDFFPHRKSIWIFGTFLDANTLANPKPASSERVGKRGVYSMCQIGNPGACVQAPGFPIWHMESTPCFPTLSGAANFGSARVFASRKLGKSTKFFDTKKNHQIFSYLIDQIPTSALKL